MKMNETEVEALINRILMKRESGKDGVYLHPYRPDLPIGTVFRFIGDNEKFIVCECDKDEWPCEVCEFNAHRHKEPKLVLTRESQCQSFCCGKNSRGDNKMVFAKKVEE